MNNPGKVGSGAPRAKITAPAVVALKRKGEPITVVTAYDFPTARLADLASLGRSLMESPRARSDGSTRCHAGG